MKNKSFTLIELLVVIAVIGLLASIVIVNLAGTRSKANIAKGLQFSQSVHHALGSEAVGVWSFDEGSGTTANDASGYGNNGTLTNGPVWRCDDTPSGSGCSLQFDGVNDYVNIGDSLEWPGALSVESWHKRTLKDTERADAIVGNWLWNPDVNLRRGWILRYYINSDNLSFIIELTDGSSVEEKNVIYRTNVGEWYHAVGVFDPSDRSVKLYVNGILRYSQTASVGFDQIAFDSSYPMRIGYNPINAGYFPGLIDEVRIYEQVLETAQIESLYYAGLDRLLAKGLIDEEEYQERLALR